ncbi:MAG: DUF4254 domain-containing protein [Ferruginibacter sp.]
MEVQNWVKIFQQSINQFHVKDDVNVVIENPYAKDTFEHLLFLKNWVDTVQWHLEDIIRSPEISAQEVLAIKRRIDASNQHRTDLVEFIDGWFYNKYNTVETIAGASFNTETPAWAIDRLSILELKIYHMQIEAERISATDAHRDTCQKKLDILLTQRADMCTAITQLIDDIASGKKYMKLYKQMKMYNDETLNPVLYNKK